MILRASTDYYHPGDSGHCLKEYRFGSDFVADFLIINPRRSLAPIITLVELEPVEDNLFTKKGIPTQRLAVGLRQVREWFVWIQQNREYFIKSIQKLLRNAIDPLSLQQWFRRGEVELNSFIFIGRREKVIDKDIRTLWSEPSLKLNIHTYDTILDISGIFDDDFLNDFAEEEMKRFILQARKTSHNSGEKSR